MTLRNTTPWVLAAGAIAWLLWLSGGPALHAQQPASDDEEVLLGFDPILLIDGREELGQDDLAVVHDGFKYLFVSEEHRRVFERDPARYAVQLGGVCARMGDTVRGDADNYAVVDGRIYLFGSQDCRTAFTADPAKYLEPAVTPVDGSADAVARGRALVERAVAAMGGAAAVDAVSGYHVEYVQTSTTADGQVQEREGAESWLLPGRFRADRVFPNFGAVADVLDGTDAFSSSPRGVQMFQSGARDALARRLARQPLVLLGRRGDAGVTLAWTADRVVDGRTVSRVDVSTGVVRATLGIDAASGRLVSLSWIGHGSEGIVGEITQRFSDFRPVADLTLPFRAEASFGNERFANQSWAARAIQVNAGVTGDLFARPVAGR